MNSDISEQIKDILTSTIETAFGDGSSISIQNSYKVTKDYLSEVEVVTVAIGFAFEKLDTKLQIIIPARTATKIAFAMLMEDTPPIDTINNDIADAMKESIGQVCGSLQTSLNSSAYEDLGKTTFSIGAIEIKEGKTYEQIGSLIVLKLLIGEDLFDYFIDFDETFTPFVEEFQNSPLLETAPKEEEILPFEDENREDIESSETDKEAIQSEEETQQNVDSIPIQNDATDESQETQQTIKEDENIDEGSSKQEELPIDKKAKRLKIAIIALGATIALIIITFLVLLFMGTFDKEELPLDKNGTKETNQTAQTDESLVLMEIQNKQIDFKIDMIDVNRLNEKLKYLTKYEILEEDALAKYTQEEEERLYKIRMEKLEQFALNNREESLVSLSNQTQTQEMGEKPINRFDEELDKNASEQNTTSTEFKQQLEATPLVFIKVDPKLYKKYKPTIDENRDELMQVSICKSEDGKINVYIGPMYVKSVLNDIINQAKKIDTNSKRELIITSMKREQFNKICDL